MPLLSAWRRAPSAGGVCASSGAGVMVSVVSVGGRGWLTGGYSGLGAGVVARPAGQAETHRPRGTEGRRPGSVLGATGFGRDNQTHSLSGGCLPARERRRAKQTGEGPRLDPGVAGPVPPGALAEAGPGRRSADVAWCWPL